VTWLDRRVSGPPVKGRPWRPEAISGVSTARLRYVVVDEVFSARAELSISEWPVMDGLGRLRFPKEDTLHIEVDARRMRTYLRRHRMPRKGVARELRVGDAFGFAVRSRTLTAFLSTPVSSSPLPLPEQRKLLDPATWEWLVPPVYDVTAEAREAAKLSYYGALTMPLPPEVVERS
jgi:hypothetical protein